MEKMSRFISIVPTVPNTTMETEHHPKRRPVQTSSRFRRFRGHRRIHHRVTKPSSSNNQSTTLEEISDETTTPVAAAAELENQPMETTVIPLHSQEQNESIVNENIMSTTVTVEKHPAAITDLSAIEKLDATSILDHPSTLMISSTDYTCPTNRTLVLTTSSLDETQKVIFLSKNSLFTRFSSGSISFISRSISCFNEFYR